MNSGADADDEDGFRDDDDDNFRDDCRRVDSKCALNEMTFLGSKCSSVVVPRDMTPIMDSFFVSMVVDAMEKRDCYVDNDYEDGDDEDDEEITKPKDRQRNAVCVRACASLCLRLGFRR